MPAYLRICAEKSPLQRYELFINFNRKNISVSMVRSVQNCYM